MSGIMALLGLWALLGAIWLAVWPFFSGAREPIDPRMLELQELEIEKARLLGEIHELELDYDTGKLSDEDYERFESRLRARAVEVMREIDERESSALAHRSKKARKKGGERKTVRAR